MTGYKPLSNPQAVAFTESLVLCYISQVSIFSLGFLTPSIRNVHTTGGNMMLRLKNDTGHQPQLIHSSSKFSLSLRRLRACVMIASTTSNISLFDSTTIY